MNQKPLKRMGGEEQMVQKDQENEVEAQMDSMVGFDIGDTLVTDKTL